MFKFSDLFVKSALSVILVCSSLPTQAQSDIASTDPVEHLAKFVEFLKDLQSNLDRKQFDLEELIAHLDYDPLLIESFIKRNIGFQQYSGVLRGPKGTLASGSGNALDQSVLLAKLFKDAGYDARVLRGKLDHEQANALLQQTSSGQSYASPFRDDDLVSATIRKHANKLGFDPSQVLASLSPDQASQDVQAEYVKQTRSNQVLLLDQFPSEVLTTLNSSNYEKMITEAKDYFWVQYRLGPNEPWTDSHPALETSSFETVKAEEYFNEEIPKSLQHLFAFEVVATQDQMGKQVEHVILPRWQRPAANLAGVQLTFNLQSKVLAALVNNGGKLEPPDDRSDILIPLFNGKATGTAIDLYGNAVDLEAAGSSFAGIFQTVQGKSHAAATAISSLGKSAQDKPTNPMFLKSLQINYYLTTPGKPESRFSRPLYVDDGSGLLDPKSRYELYNRLTETYSIGLQTGGQNPAYALEQSLNTIISNFDYFLLVARHAQGENIGELLRNAIPEQPWRWVGLDLMPSIFDALPIDASDVLYRPEATVFVHSKTLGIGSIITESVDIIQSPHRAINTTKNMVDTSLVLKAGVWNTIAEGALVGKGKSNRLDVAGVFAQAGKGGIDLVTISGSNIEQLGTLKVSEFARDKISSDLDLGFTIIIPRHAPDANRNTIAWWRVDTETGNALGMLVNGTRYGGGITEHAELIIGISGALVATAGFFAYISCSEGDGACQICAGATGVLGAAGIIGAIPAAQGLALLVGLVGAIVGAVCAIGSFLDWNQPPLTPPIE